MFTPDCAPTKAVYKEPLNICNLPPMLIDFAIPAPPETTNPPVDAETELSVELSVAVPVDAPNDNVVAAPKALMLVAVALKTLNVAEPVVTLVVKFGDVPNTSAPEPVSSLITPSNSADVVAANTLSLFPAVVKVPAFGTVTFDAVVVVKVRLFAPDVTRDEPSAKVKVADVVGAVIATLFILVADATPNVGVVSDGELLKTNSPLPVSSDITPKSSFEVVAAKTESLFPVVVSVPAVGIVTLDAAVVVSVREFAPDVTNEEPEANVKVAEAAGAVIVTLLYVVAETVPLASMTPEIDDEKPTPVYREPAIPAPPETTNAPEPSEVEAVLYSTANLTLLN